MKSKCKRAVNNGRVDGYSGCWKGESIFKDIFLNVEVTCINGLGNDRHHTAN